jgi:hypothetical protein
MKLSVDKYSEEFVGDHYTTADMLMMSSFKNVKVFKPNSVLLF